MPAHTCASSVGSVVCSDGTVLTEAMRCANDMADGLAKRAAETVRISRSSRQWLQSRFVQAKQLAIFVGQLTDQAGAHRQPGGEIARDSVGIDAGAARSRKGKARKKKAPKPQPVDMSAVALEQRSGKIAEVLQRIRSKMLVG